MLDAGDVVDLWRQRSMASDSAKRMSKARLIRDAVNGDLALPLPELDKDEAPMVANLLQIGLDQSAMRVSSLMPDQQWPATKPGQKTAERKSTDRRRAAFGWWEANSVDLLMDRRARHYFAYAGSPVMIRPDPKLKGPRWVLRDPLGTFPAETTNPDDVEPDDCVFAFRRSWGWLRRNYPDEAARLKRLVSLQDSDMIDLLEFVDDAQQLLVAVGYGSGGLSSGWSGGGYSGSGNVVLPRGVGAPTHGTEPAVALLDVPNRAGLCTAVCAGKVSLDRPAGQMDGALGLYQNQAMLLALHFLGVKKDVFGETWAVARPNESVNIVRAADGLRRITGIVEGGDIKAVHHPPGFQTEPLLNYLERGIRIGGTVPADYTGESASNVRTARRGQEILSSTVDFTVQAAHKMFSRSLQAENRRAVAVAKAYYGSMPVSFYVSWKGAKGRVDYTPDDLFDTDENIVQYASAGADASSLVVGLGQRASLWMSEQTAARLDPMIDDPEFEHDRRQFEALERGVLADFQQPSPDPRMLLIKARVMELVRSDRLELTEAIARVQREEQEKQASSGPPGSPTGPVPEGAPEAQPGIAPAGVGEEAPAIGPPTGDVSNLSSLLTRLQRPAQIARSG